MAMSSQTLTEPRPGLRRGCESENTQKVTHLLLRVSAQCDTGNGQLTSIVHGDRICAQVAWNAVPNPVQVKLFALPQELTLQFFDIGPVAG